MKTTIVVPTIREANIVDFLNAWRSAFAEAHIIVVEDNPTRTFDLRDEENVTHVSWEDIERDLGQDSWIIPRRTDCIRSYGYYRAYQDRPDMLVTLDDDCYPIEGEAETFLDRHWRRLNAGGESDAWRTSARGVATRGVPYHNLRREWPAVLNHGMWTGVPDYDAPTQLVRSRLPTSFDFEDQVIPVGVYYPMCGMNVALRPEVIPAFYFMLMGKGYEYDRFGDIWAGILVKRICDHLGFAIHSGHPAVAHQRASNVWANLRKEAAALEQNETFWLAVDNVRLTQTTFGACYMELARKLPLEGEYWSKLRRAMETWAELFEESTPTVSGSDDGYEASDLASSSARMPGHEAG